MRNVYEMYYNCHNYKKKIMAKTMVTTCAGIQAKLYNQDLSLDASFDAGGNIGR